MLIRASSEMKVISLWLIGLGLVILVGMYFWPKKNTTSGLIELGVGKVKLEVEVRDTAIGRSQGLSGKESLGEDEGMLFVFEKPGIHGFWMKGMKFDLDFIWILNDLVVEITESVPATKKDGMPVSLRPSQLVDKVLEVNSGWVKNHNIKIGDKVE